MSIREEMHRRAALGAGVAGMAAATVSRWPSAALLAADETTANDNWIDAHSHIWTRDVEKFPLAQGKTVDDLDPPSFTEDELIRVSRKHGVTRVVLIQHHTYHGWDNSYLIAAAARFPRRFRVVGMVNDRLPNPDKAMRGLLPQKVTGFRITPRIFGKDRWLSGPGMAAMWKCAADTRQAMCCLIDRDDLPAVDKMCRRFPDTPVVIDHFARIGADGVIRNADVRRLCDLAQHRHTFVKISAFYALGKKSPPYADLMPMVRRVFEAFGPQRLMWASDAPYQLVAPHDYESSIGLVRDRLDFLSRSDREWLLRETAEKVYFFDT